MAWRVALMPDLSLGGSAAPLTEQFDGTWAARRLRDGRILAGDRSNWRVLIFGPDGRPQGQFGREGRGPGEFDDLIGIFELHGDTLAIPMHTRGLQFFDREGKYLTHRYGPTPDSPGRPPAIVAPLRDGSWLAMTRTPPTQPRTPGTIRTDTATIVRLGAGDGSGRPLLELPIRTYRVDEKFGQVSMRFAPFAWVETVGDGFCATWNATYLITCHNPDGTTRRVIRRSLTGKPPTDALIARAVRSLTEMPMEAGAAPNAAFQERRRLLAEAMPNAKVLPAIAQLLGDPDGNLWVRYYGADDAAPKVRDPMNLPMPEEPSRWAVHDPQGRWLGDVTLPTGFRVLQIDRDGVLGLAIDADDVQLVRWYRLIKP